MREAAFLDALGQRDLGRAQKLLEALAKDLPRPRFLFMESLLLRKRGDLNEAMKRLDMALVLHLSDPELWAAKASVLEEMGKLDMARRAADRACRLSPDNFDHQILCANIMYSLKDYRAAMAQVDKALGLDPRSSPALVLKGVLISLLEQDHLNALTFFDSAVEIDPGNGSAWCNRGITLRQIGDRDGSIFSLQRALIINKHDQAARDSLLSMGAERYIPQETKAAPEIVNPSPPETAEGPEEESGTLSPEEWGEEDAFESVDDGGDASKEEHGRKTERPIKELRRRIRTDRGQRTPIEKVDCPRCNISFEPITDKKGHFECPSCGLRGRLELD
ncbi:MAG: tetratricopeptide repeat protein [Candidatus Thermoplasmatota archaeon]|jgi:tetratricopeptide (TPR) repeat protein|nr:tetratricopeptide repeat protein [Candidatus Thermoplasmatota archaeon]